MKKFILSLAAALTIGFTANAVPARPGVRTITQPDGTVIEAELVGDERMHFYRTAEGTPMMLDTEGYMRFATTDSNGRLALGKRVTALNMNASMSPAVLDATYRAMAEEADERAYPQQGKGLFTSSYPRTGEVHCLVFLVEYTDVKFQVEDPEQYFNDMLNKEGFDEYGANGSARDYFLYQSKEQFRPTFDVYGPVKLAHNQKYYGGNDWYGNDQNAPAMVLEACEAYADEIDFSNYDYDNDGKVDNIYVFYAGQGEASYGGANSVWPHSWNITDGPTYNGKQIFSYTCSNEWEQTRPDGIGTFCHEFSHTMGLPDLYSTTYNQYQTQTPGRWSVLDMGPYNNDGRTPPNYSAYERNAMGWLDAIEVSGPETIQLEPVDVCNRAVIIATENEDEFFLFENRQQEGWDAYIPGHGMLVWHIDFDQTVFDKNTVNNQAHQYVDIVEANGRANNNSNIAMAGYAFPGTSENTEFSAETSPGFVDWSGNAIDLPITDITETADGLIVFNVAGGSMDLEVPTGLKAEANDKGELTVTWEPVLGASFYLLSVYTTENDTPVHFGDYKDKRIKGATTHTLTGISGPRTYLVSLKAANNSSATEACEPVEVDVPKINFNYTVPTALEATGVYSDAFTANWREHPDAESYHLTVEGSVFYGENPDEVVDFGNGSALQLPAGWDWSGSVTSLYYSSASGYFGNSAPSLKFQNSEDMLTSPLFEVPIANISFWVRGASATDESSFIIEGRGKENYTWREIQSIEPLSEYNNSTGVTWSINLINDLTYKQVRFRYNKGSRGNAALDDIVIGFPAESYTPLDGYNDRNMGNTLSATITNIPEEYEILRYSIQAVNADGRYSDRSNYVTVKLGGESGISTPAVLTGVSVNGNTVTYTGTEGEVLTVADVAGRTVARASVGADGNATVELPSGFYIVSAGNAATKVAIR